MGREIFQPQHFLIGKEPVVHLPVLSLLSGAVGRLVRLECLGMDRLDGKVAEDVFDLAGRDVFAF